MSPETLTIAQAARQLGVTPGAIRSAIAAGRLAVVRETVERVRIPQDAVDAYRVDRARQARAGIRYARPRPLGHGHDPEPRRTT